jgi:hypothetical protein
MQRSLAVVFLLGAVAPPVAAQRPGEVIKLQIQPAAVPSPALKYKLLPKADELAPGNAVQLYYRAFAPDWFTKARKSEVYNGIVNALDTPVGELPRKDLEWLLTSNQLKEIDLAARRESCDWDLMRRIKKDGLGMLLPDIQTFRQFATLLACRARLQIAGRDYNGATYTFQTGISMSRHLGDAPTLISSLVGVASTMIMLNQVEEMIRSQGSPNLYWALTELPTPFIPIQKGLQGEEVSLFATFPLLRDIETTRFSLEQMQVLLGQFYDSLRWVSENQSSGMEQQLTTLGLVMKQYTAAKKALIAEGRKPEEVEALPALQVVLIHSLHQFERLRDNLYKGATLPYWQALPEFEKGEADLRKARANLEAMPFIYLLPAIQKVRQGLARLDRRIAALRCVEAVRIYAAAHDGKLPASLSEIKEVPIPVDPMSGSPFDYKLEGDKALLNSPGLEKDPYNAVRYELTLQR